ncbi:MAG: dTDP-6-deoxy-3,4-keto-hexulose isomerase [Spirochaetes bacterium GWF1_31_7]|nr:MAG: dTDP-6-deoxy-3,4-keto-hexulose isomerase [Spirochaetes bacterium GWE1_32_154]OHD47136.1 MAG: dTDP-6-deoxy-3,4-keto-hexulose isomerase [Spirochaetes bacterium GWE2_31_10]OHD48477.1 MAG: dTDP-6-deoxy-3,4-keto-hexulose isomerase [Spirochaetes bacterium GWF1_31_7]
MADKIKLLDFPEKGDENGLLVAIQNGDNIPFNIKRLFYIYGTKQNIIRGNHANKISQFVLISISGSCKVKTFDGLNEQFFSLNKPSIGLYLDKMVWKEMYDFSKDCVLLVLTDTEYDPSEYIYDKNNL